MDDEILETPLETPAPEIPTGVQPTAAPVQAEAPAPPPAAALVMEGGIVEERLAIAERRAEEAERGRIEAERRAAELERDNQVLKEIPKPAPTPRPAKVKRKNYFTPIIGAEDENE